jgi:hypothetical protein
VAFEKLTRQELQNRVNDFVFKLGGGQNASTTGLWNYLVSQNAIEAIPDEQDGDLYYPRISTSGSISQQRSDALLRLAQFASSYAMDFATSGGTSARRRTLLGSCANTLPLTVSCRPQVATRIWNIVSLGAPDTDKIAVCTDYLATLGNEGLHACFSHAFLSVEFNYVELIGEEVSSDESRLTPLELAHRLSRTFWLRPPNAQLLSWVTDNTIRNDYESVVNYVLNHAHFQESLRTYFYGFLRLNETRSVDFGSSAGVATRMNALNLTQLQNVTNLKELAVEEALNYSVAKVVQGATFEDYMTSLDSYATGALADIYGIPAWTSGQPPQRHTETRRSGALTLAALHLTDAVEKSHFHLGYQLLKTFTCRATPPLGEEGLMAAAQPYPPPNGLENSVSRAERMTADPSCSGCHVSFNSLGFSLGQIGPWGEFQSQEPVIDATSGQLLGWAPVGSTQTHSLFAGQSVTTSSPREFAQLLLDSELPQACFARNLFRWTFGREESLSTQDTCLLKQIHDNLKQPGVSMKEAMKQIALSSQFQSRYHGGGN